MLIFCSNYWRQNKESSWSRSWIQWSSSIRLIGWVMILNCCYCYYRFILFSTHWNSNILCVGRQINNGVMVGCHNITFLILFLSFLIFVLFRIHWHINRHCVSRQINNWVMVWCNKTTSLSLSLRFITLLIFLRYLSFLVLHHSPRVPTITLS